MICSPRPCTVSLGLLVTRWIERDVVLDSPWRAATNRERGDLAQVSVAERDTAEDVLTSSVYSISPRIRDLRASVSGLVENTARLRRNESRAGETVRASSVYSMEGSRDATNRMRAGECRLVRDQ